MSQEIHALTHGMNGLVLVYLVVQIPLLAGLIRSRAPLSQLLASPILAIVLVLLMGIVLNIMSPLFRRLGIAPDGVLELAIGVTSCAAAAYASGRLLAGRRVASTYYRRGAVAADGGTPSRAVRAIRARGGRRGAPPRGPRRPPRRP